MQNNDNNILAKPSGITLSKHITNVMSQAKDFEILHPILFEKYYRRIGKSLSIRLEKAIEYHDLGKKNIKWQTACRKDYEAYLVWKRIHGGTFKEYEKIVGADAAKHIRNAKFRHELDSSWKIKNNKPPLALQAAIVAHHSKLSEKHKERWEQEGVKELWDYFEKESTYIREQFSFKLAAEKQYEIAGPRGMLQFVDRCASTLEAGDFVPNLNKFEYTFPHPSKRGVQKLIEHHWEEKLLLVRAPTGAGKTDASLLWAQYQIKNKRADRLIIAMPTRFTSNALAINVAESLSDTGLYHSSAWHTKFGEKVEQKKMNRNEANKHHEFARLLQTPITVCTVDHLLMALTLTREDHHQITFNLANSCLVLDEADFYDDFTQANIMVLLEALKVWDVPVLLMSASLPENVVSGYQQLGYSVNNIIEDTSDTKRDRFTINSIINYNSIVEIETILEKCVKAGAAIIYVNTVDRAMGFYDYFARKGIESTVYHSRFTEPDKKKKEDVLIKQLGREAWEKDNASGIAILTQIGEMSINISADFMVSELCPIDRLTQRAGRLCRFEINKIGELHIIIPYRNDTVYPAPYGVFDLKEKKWIPADAFIKTQKILELKTYNANLLVSLLNEIYSKEQTYSAIAIDNAKKLKDNFRCNWLINPSQKTEMDDTDTNQWKSRNIGPQDSVYIKAPTSSYFSTYLQFQSWRLNYSIEIPVYLIKKYQSKNILDSITITIDEDKMTILVIRVDFYSFEKGVFLPDEDLFL